MEGGEVQYEKKEGSLTEFLRERIRPDTGTDIKSVLTRLHGEGEEAVGGGSPRYSKHQNKVSRQKQRHIKALLQWRRQKHRKKNLGRGSARGLSTGKGAPEV